MNRALRAGWLGTQRGKARSAGLQRFVRQVVVLHLGGDTRRSQARQRRQRAAGPCVGWLDGAPLEFCPPPPAEGTEGHPGHPAERHSGRQWLSRQKVSKPRKLYFRALWRLAGRTGRRLATRGSTRDGTHTHSHTYPRHAPARLRVAAAQPGEKLFQG